ncbi:hypothetical protein CANCADRAFT_57423 [Tortispora caseinolytica NRRL Y-17796]|uniref:ATP synthase subunit K, mitochondrial n=1 Tax=Tortispora caseinolytica NRRL Y-17796 TaxID=767744 RepID=A0A1E4TH55_9ASCO|nr:hypothetical protein CANCADRAFT_57423 [Tortispora caseinolytica NRRL Y-17796]
MAGGAYHIFGRNVYPHQLSIITLATITGAIVLSTSGKKSTASPNPPLNAASSDEEKFIMEYLAKAEKKE